MYRGSTRAHTDTHMVTFISMHATLWPQRETKKENDLNRHTANESTHEEGKDDVRIKLERQRTVLG